MEIKVTMKVELNKPNGTGVQRIIKAANCSLKGFKYTIKSEAAFRQELLLCLILLPTIYLLSSSFTQSLIMLASLFILLMAKLINSAIEALADKIKTEHDPLIGAAKDIGSATVFISISLIFIIWSLSIYHYLN